MLAVGPTYEAPQHHKQDSVGVRLRVVHEVVLVLLSEALHTKHPGVARSGGVPVHLHVEVVDGYALVHLTCACPTPQHSRMH